MDSSFAIDPNLQEAEGTYHTAPAKSRHAPIERTEYAQAPVANMGSSAAAGEDGYRKLLYPLVQAANQATQESGEGILYGLPTSASSHTSPQGKQVKKEGRPRGRPKKIREGIHQDIDAVDGMGADRGLILAQHMILDGDGDGDTMLETPKKSRKRRKRRTDERGNEQDMDGKEDEPHAKRKRTTPEPVDEEGLKDKDKEMRDSGPLSKLEWKYIDRVISDFKAENDIDDRRVRDFIQSTNRAQSQLIKDLWTRLYDSLPHRQHVAVMRACRRRFNNFEARGKWTPADDDMLRQAYLENPAKWVKIGSILDRMPEDCRDRWRNYLSCGDQRRIDDWTPKEEMDLSQAVNECAMAVKQDAKNKAKEEGHAFREQDWEACVNFNTVSEKMKFTRSRLQCYTHWKVMQNRDPDYHLKLEARKTDGPSNRQGRALANFNKMSPAEKYQIVCQIADTQAQEEDEIPWKQITRQYPHSKWTTRDRKETFAKLKDELTEELQDLPSVINALLESFRTSYPVEDLTVPDRPAGPALSQSEQQEDGLDLSADQPDQRRTALSNGYRAAEGPYFTGPQQYANEAQQLMQGQQLDGGQVTTLHEHMDATDDVTGHAVDSNGQKRGKKRGPKPGRKSQNRGQPTAPDGDPMEGHSIEELEEEKRRAAAAAEQLEKLAGGTNLTLAHHLYAAANSNSQQELDEPAEPVQKVDLDSGRVQDLATLAANQLQAESMQQAADFEIDHSNEAGYPEELSTLPSVFEQGPARQGPKPGAKRGRPKKGSKASRH